MCLEYRLTDMFETIEWPVKGTMVMHIHFVVHESFGAPGALETWIRDRGHTGGYSRAYAHEPLPQSPADIDLLVVMGGPQSPATTKGERPHFDAVAGRELIAKCVAAGKAVVGCVSALS
jgi:GMP synthase (glutamine-hydrolysing)